MNYSHKNTVKKASVIAVKPSVETVEAAAKIAAGIKKPGQDKAQTKLIEQGIQKGIELYKKAQKAKAREADKAKKKQNKLTAEHSSADNNDNNMANKSQPASLLAWSLLVLSWLFFVLFYFFTVKFN